MPHSDGQIWRFNLDYQIISKVEFSLGIISFEIDGDWNVAALKSISCSYLLTLAASLIAIFMLFSVACM